MNKVVAFVFSVAIVGLCMVLPVWQSAVNYQLENKIACLQSEISISENEIMGIKADIAKRLSPEYLIEQAVSKNLNFRQIEKTSYLAMEIKEEQ